MAYNAGYASPLAFPLPLFPATLTIAERPKANLYSPLYQEYAHTSAASPLANLVILAAGSAPAMARTTTSPGVRGKAQRL